MLLLPDRSLYFTKCWCGIFLQSLGFHRMVKFSGRKCALDFREEWLNCFKLMGSQDSNLLHLKDAEEHLWVQNTLNFEEGGWVMAAKDHIGCHSCLLRTEIWGYNSKKLTKTGQQKAEKRFPGLVSLSFYCNIQMAAANNKASCLV